MSDVRPDVYRYPFDASLSPKDARAAGRAALAKMLKIAEEHTSLTSYNEVDGDVRDYTGNGKRYTRWLERKTTHAFPRQRGLRMLKDQRSNQVDRSLPGGHIQAEHIRHGYTPTSQEAASEVEVLYSEYQHPPRLQVTVFDAEALPAAVVQGIEALGLKK